jgi:large subunit ribosomal protein L29
MKVNELRAKSPEELTEALRELLREQFNLRMQNANGQLSDNSQIKKVRRNIGRVRTVMNETTADKSGAKA